MTGRWGEGDCASGDLVDGGQLEDHGCSASAMASAIQPGHEHGSPHAAHVTVPLEAFWSVPQSRQQRQAATRRIGTVMAV